MPRTETDCLGQEVSKPRPQENADSKPECEPCNTLVWVFGYELACDEWAEEKREQRVEDHCCDALW